MTTSLWFVVGVGGAAALWWTRFCVRWLTFDKCEKFDPFHIVSDFEPEPDPPYIAGFFFGLVVTILSPIWMLVYAPYCVRRRWGGRISLSLRPAKRAVGSAYLRALGGDPR